MSINDINEFKPTETKPVEIKSPYSIEPPVGDDISLRAISQITGNENEVSQYESELKILLDYAKTQTKDHSPENLKWIIRQLELKTGTPPFGEKAIKYLARFAFLSLEQQKINKELESYGKL